MMSKEAEKRDGNLMGNVTFKQDQHSQILLEEMVLINFFTNIVFFCRRR